jgi:hypothetical protein
VGVELGKKLASRVEAEIHYADALDHHDPSTAALIRRARKGRS